MSPEIKIGKRRIGQEYETYIIAEMSANHNQSFDYAVNIVRAAAESGADAIKFQTYTADTITLECDSDLFKIKGTLWEGTNLHRLYHEAHTPWDWQPKLKRIAEELGLDCFSTPFDPTAVDFLEAMDVPAYKIASFELVDIPLIEKIARTKKPTIISTGMGSLGEIDEAVRAFRAAGGDNLALLKCTSAYPSPPEEMNLRTIQHMSEAFSVPVGLSDHTTGTVVPTAAVALGASLIEKHLTLSRSAGGPDSAFSLEPGEFKEMVRSVRAAKRAIGRVTYEPTPAEKDSRIFRRSLFVIRDIPAGAPFSAENIRSIRPAHGLPPKLFAEILGYSALRDLKKGEPLTRDLIGPRAL